jgi:hypothetical protein
MMPHVTMEYVIMIPILLMQVLLLPLATGWMMTTWVDSRRQLALQDAVNHLGSTIQQLYYSLNREGVSPGIVTQASNVPPTIESHPYNVTGTLTTVSTANSSKVLKLTAILFGTQNTATAKVVLGTNVAWRSSTFLSVSANAHVRAERFSNGTILFSFGGG